MKITEQQLQFLFQLAMDSVKMNLLGFFSYTIEQRVNVVNAIMNQQSGEVIDIKEAGDEEPTLEVQYYKEAKKMEPPKKEKVDFLPKAISLLRQWRQGAGDGAGQFLLSTNTIEFLDRFDKEACHILKEDSYEL